MSLCSSTTRMWLAGFSIAAATSSPATLATPLPPPHPLADYAPVQAMLLSEDLFAAGYHGPELVAAIVAAGAEPWIVTAAPRQGAALEGTLRAAGVSAADLAHAAFLNLPHGNIWMRDYGPQPLAGADGRLAFAAFRYSDPGATDNRNFAVAAARSFGAQLFQAPVEVDGGNFLTNGEFCFTSAADLPKPKLGTAAGPAALPPYGGLFGCRATVVIDDPPLAHLDLWMRIDNDRTALVNELDERALAAAKSYYGHLPPEITELSTVLNRKADELARYLTVKRLPMPLPYRGAFRTYTNSLLINGHAVVPAFDRFGWGYDDYPDAALKRDYEQRVKAVYEDLGYQVTFVNADGLIYNGGGFRCVTAQIPDQPRRLTVGKGR